MTNDFQSRSSKVGKAFEDECAELLERCGFVEIERRPSFPEVGVEADVAALTAGGAEIVFECKAGTAETKRPGGMADTDNIKKAIADASLLATVKDPVPYIVLTTHIAEAGRGAAMINRALDIGLFFAVVNVRQDTDGIEMLRGLAASTGLVEAWA